MAWTSGLQELASRNPFIAKLQAKGYDLEFINGHLVVYGVPYLNSAGELSHLDMVSALDLREQFLIDKPTDHKIYFSGVAPCNFDGTVIKAGYCAEARKVSDQINCTHRLSSKPVGKDKYESIEEKITHYIDLVSSPATYKFPSATPQRAIIKHREAPPSPLKYPDALSAREGMVDLSHRLCKKRVAIIGCGGTGAYVLDYMAKTHVEEIHLFDDDIVHVHTLFRLPGVYSQNHLGLSKVEVLASVYGEFHGGVKPHVERVANENLECVSGFDFIFICIDDGPSRQVIAQACNTASIPFVDVGMGLNKGANGLYGFVRTAGGASDDFDRLNGTQHLPSQNAHDKEYRNQPQIAEVNALNAAMAVIRFKQSMGFYDRLTDSHAVVFDIAGMTMDSAT